MSYLPETLEELNACADIVWGDEGRDCHTKLHLREKCEQVVREMREAEQARKDADNQAAFERAGKRWGHLEPELTLADVQPNKVCCPFDTCGFTDFDPDRALVLRCFRNHLRTEHGVVIP